ncbi:MAG: amino acid adenylation domain-containing protein [Moraxellaceae bacterium]|nr:MAG: amino acid adenylation domain-containing protein [Moraxellaceae bacterium]
MNNKIEKQANSNDQRQVPLVSTQHGIWLADQVSQKKNRYVISHCIELQGKVDIVLLQQAICQGLVEADTVTAEYSSNLEQPVQTLREGLTAGNISLPELVDLSDVKNSRQQAMQLMWQDTHADLAISGQRPLYRQILFNIGNEQQPHFLWYQRYHHIMLDGFSFTSLTRRIAEIYTALVYTTRGQQQENRASPFIAVDQVVQEYQSYQQSAAHATDRQFWKDYCADLPVPVSLGNQIVEVDNKTKIALSQHSVEIQDITPVLSYAFNLGNAITLNLQTLAERHKVGLPELLMVLFTSYLYRINGQRMQVIGVPFMRRLGSVAIRSTAPVVNVLPLKAEIDPKLTWLQLATNLQKAMRQLRKHQRYNAEQIQRDLNRVESEQNLYGPVFNYKLFDYELDFAGIAGITHHLATGPVDDLEFNVTQQQGSINIELRADTQRYDQQALHTHAARLTTLLEKWLVQPEQAVGLISVLPETEQQLITGWSTGQAVGIPASHTSILDIFETQVAQMPHAIALVSGQQQLTFAQLAQQVAALAALLIRYEVSGKVVAAAIPRSLESVIALLAIFKAGATFLPLDLDYPADRIAMMCEDANPAVILSTTAVTTELPGTMTCLILDEPAVQIQLQQYRQPDFEQTGIPVCRNQVAYIIFTSGSTGRPKGVMNTHGALLNLLASHHSTIYQPALQHIQQQFNGRILRAAHTHSFSFDSSWLQLFWMLLGQELHIFDEVIRRDAYALVQEVRHLQIDTMDLPPSFCAQMLSNGLFDTGQHHPSLILLGGEAVPAALWQQLKAQAGLQVYNLYGPTEYTVDTLRAPLGQNDKPVIGHPIANTQVYVLDVSLQHVPIGVIGELYISGAGLAKGYLGRADLTAARFVANPFASTTSGERMYRTGDLVRWNNDGQLEFMGRSDDQIKVRGYRVELGEVENALSLLPSVESAVIIAERINNSHRLLGYCVVRNQQGQALLPEQAQQREQELLLLLQQHLPDYMLPSCLMVLSEFPRNVSGKVDKKLLPKPDFVSISQQIYPPETPAEQLLCQHMLTVLKLPIVGVEDSFFALGGDSISAIMLCTRLRNAGYLLKPSEVFALKTARKLAAALIALDTASAQQLASQSEVPKSIQQDRAQLMLLQDKYPDLDCILPVLPLQKGMLFHAQLDAEGDTYNAFTRISLHGPLDISRLQQALNAVLSRHPQLAGLFELDIGEEPVFVLPKAEKLVWPLQYHDLSHYPLAEQQQHIDTIEQQLLKQQAVDQGLSQHGEQRFCSLINAGLLDLGQQEYSLVLVIHHLIVDGWSTPLILKDLFAAYAQHPAQLPALNDSYASVIAQLVQRNLDGSRELWKRALHGVRPTVLFENIPASNPVEEYVLNLPAQLSTALQLQTRQRGITLNVLMQGVWSMVLGSMSSRSDVVFGTPVSGRTAAIVGIEDQVGLFLNTIPVRINLQAEQSLWQQLDIIQQQHIERLENDGLGLAEIQQLAGEKNLFDTLLVVENYPDSNYASTSLDGLQVGEITNRGYSHYPLALLVIPGQQIQLLVENRGAIEDAKALAQHIEHILNQLITQPDLPVARYCLLTPQEQDFIAHINRTDYPLSATNLRERLIAQARQCPAAIALVDAQHKLNYAQLREQVKFLAHQLVEAGVKPGSIVAISLPRSVQLSIAILAVIEAGAAYLPLDLSYPDDRLFYMLADSKPQVLITNRAAQQRLAGQADILMFDELALIAEPLPELSVELSPQHPAYIIYTSGTTGRPKGVLVSHEAIMNRLDWMQHEYRLNPNDVILQKTPCSFDVSVWEFFWAYLVGAKLVMAGVDAHRDPEQLVEAISRYGVTTLHFVPSMLAIFTSTLTEQYLPAQLTALPLRQVFCSGEALTKVQAQAFSASFTQARLHNLYGPTEAAVDVTYRPAYGDFNTKLGQGGASVPIGRPVWNTQLRILDQYLRPVPVGVSGELYLSGIQLAMGYLGRTDLTASRFVADPFEQGQRMYRTGDVARWLANGEVEYLGRSDDQIKIRGLRVELGEIETLIQQFPGIAQAVVHATVLGDVSSSGIMQAGADNRQLVAYFTLQHADTGFDIEALKQHLQAQLPAHMVPVAYIQLQQLPLSSNGKLDRKALPKPDRVIQQQSGRKPEPGLESQLAEVFARLLGRTDIDADADFFAMGGHSLLAMRLAAEIRRELKQQVNIGQIMVSPTIAKLANHLSQQSDTDPVNPGLQGFDSVMTIREGQGQPLICVYPGSGFAWQYTVLAQYIEQDMPIIGLQSPRPHGLIATSQTMEQLIDRQLEVIRKIQPSGPYYLLGYSLGGTIAYGLARRLLEQGEHVSFLGLLDTYPAEVHSWDDPQGEEANRGAEREQEQLFNHAMGDDVDKELQGEKDALQQQIFGNYRDAVRLLTDARTESYAGKVTVFVAEQSLPDYIHPREHWLPHVGELELHHIHDFSHEDLLSPESLQTLGPKLNQLISHARSMQVSNMLEPEPVVSTLIH